MTVNMCEYEYNYIHEGECEFKHDKSVYACLVCMLVVYGLLVGIYE